MKTTLKKITQKAVGFIGKLIPIKRGLMLLESHDDFTDNSFAFYEYITKNHPDIKCVWLISKQNEAYAKQHGYNYIICSNTLKVIWYKFRSKYFLFSYRNFNYFPLKKGQIHINLWHGTPLKCFNGKSISNVDKPDYYFLSPTQKVFELFRRIAPMTDNVIYCGYPRLDFFDREFSPEYYERARRFLESLGSDGRKKTVIMMPTFRFDKRASKDFYEQFPFPMSEESFGRLNEKLIALGVLLIIKLHHMQNKVDIAGIQDKFSNIRFIKNIDLVNNNIQLYNIVAQSDALITDYSSISYDYMVLDKPIGYLINDIESYASKEGFVFEDPLEYMPGDKFTDIEGMISFIGTIVNNEDKYKCMRRRISGEMNDEGVKYSEKLWQKICEIDSNH